MSAKLNKLRNIIRKSFIEGSCECFRCRDKYSPKNPHTVTFEDVTYRRVHLATASDKLHEAIASAGLIFKTLENGFYVVLHDDLEKAELTNQELFFLYKLFKSTGYEVEADCNSIIVNEKGKPFTIEKDIATDFVAEEVQYDLPHL